MINNRSRFFVILTLLNSNKGFLSKIIAFIRGNFFIPDARKGWNSFAIRTGEEILKKEKIHSVITTGPPHSTHLIGLKLREKFKCVYV